jgi:hypothetical protein
MEVLKDLFDEKIVEVISLFVENPEKKYFLTDVSNITRINITTTFRILNKLVSKNFLKQSLVGKIRLYQLEKNEKTLELIRLLKKTSTPLNDFIEEVTTYQKIKKIILESKDKDSAKILIVGEYLPQDKIQRLIEKIKQKNNFLITYVEINEKQYEGLKNFQNYNLDKKMIWKED